MQKDDFNPARSVPAEGGSGDFNPSRAVPFQEPPSRGLKGWAKDLGAGTLDLAIGVPEAAVGLLDIPTGGRVGKFLENEGGSFGFRPKQAREITSKLYSDATQAAEQKFQDADGIVDKAAVAVQNPSVIAKGIGTSLGLMGAGGVVGRGALAATRLGQMGAKGAAIAGAAGEGVVGAGSAAEQIRQQTDDGLLTGKQAGLAAATGLATGAIGFAGNKVANRLGIGDADMMLAQGTKGMAKDAAERATAAAVNPLAAPAQKSILRQMGEGAIAEGVLEELPQSVSEQILQNEALGKSWSEGLDEAVVMGILSGGAMGAGAAGYRGFTDKQIRDAAKAQQDAQQVAGAAAGDSVQAAGTPWTTSAGAAGEVQPGTAPASESNAPNLDYETMPGAAAESAGNEIPFDRDFDTSGLSLQSTGPVADAPVLDHEDLRDKSGLVMPPQLDTGRIEVDTGLAPLSNETPARQWDTGSLSLLGDEQPQAPLSQRMGLNPNAGALSKAAVMAVDSGASSVTQPQLAPEQGQAPVQQQAAPEVPAGVDPDTGEITLQAQIEEIKSRIAYMQQQGAAQGWNKEMVAQRNALQTQLTKLEVQGAKEQKQGASTTSAPAPVELTGINQILAKKVPDMSADDLQQAIAHYGPNHKRTKKLEKALQALAQKPLIATETGAKNNDAQTPQAQQGSSQPTQAGAAQTSAPAAQGVSAHATPAQYDGAQAGAPTAAKSPAPSTQAAPAEKVEAAQAIAQKGNAQREQERQRQLDASERWTRMTTAERQAVAAVAPGLNVIARKNLHTRAWADIGEKSRAKLVDSLVNPSAGIADKAPAAIKNEAKAQSEATSGQAQGMADAKSFAPESGTLGIPRADMPQVPAASHGGLVKHLNAQGIAHETKTVDAADLKPTQAEYSPAKVEAAKSATGDRAVIVSSDGHIIDGHHQAVAAAEEGKQVKAIVLDAPVEQALEAVKGSPSANTEATPAPVPAPKSVAERMKAVKAAKGVKAEAESKVKPKSISAKAREAMAPRAKEADSANYEGAAQRRPASAQDKAVMQAIADGKSARDVLRVVASGSKNPLLRQTARLLLKSGISPTIEFGHIGLHKGNPIHGQYRGKTDTIAIAGSAEYAAERIFMHEAMHAATMRALAKPGMVRLQLQKLAAHVRKQPGAAGFYGISDKNGNVDEFVAEAFTNPDFQAALRKINAPTGSTIKTAWDGFVRILRSILGLPNDSTNALSQALQLGVAAMREDMALRQQGARSSGSAEMVEASRDLQRARILQGEPVAVLSLEDAPTGGYTDIARWAATLFAQQGGKAVSPDIGEVTLNEQSARDSMAHGGANAAKKIAFAAVKDVIERGTLVYQARHGRLDSFYVSAPVRISGRDNIVTALVHRDQNTQRMYLHSVALKENLLKPSVSAVDAKASELGSATTSGDRATVAKAKDQGKAASSDVARELNRLLKLDTSDNDVANFGADDFTRIKTSALDQLSKTFTHAGKVSLWDKSVGTMRHLAERAPAFKPVYEAASQNIDDVSMLANDAANMAPRILPRVETLGDLKKKPVSVADNKAVAKPLFEGTLIWARDENGKPALVDDLQKRYANLSVHNKAAMLLKHGKIDAGVLAMWQGLPVAQFEKLINSRFESKVLKAGIVWSDSELKSQFSATDNQISLYRETRAAIDRSIDMTARTDMLRVVGDKYEAMREAVLDQPSVESAAQLLLDTLEQDAKADPDSADRLGLYMQQIKSRMETAVDLQKSGYAPLSRFGRYTVDVVDANGERQYFGMYETVRESNLAKMQLAQEFKGATVTTGTMSAEAYKLFAGVTPETLEQFGEMLGLKAEGNEAQDKAFQEFLKLTKNNHSAMKRMIHRKGIAGFSEDIGRVVANFVYSNARAGAMGLNAGKMDTAINAIPKDQGELKDLAMGLRSYIRDPQEEGQAVRGMLFAQYLGGSIASAFVNTTQPFAVTLPWLSQYGGMKKASSQLARALKDMAAKGHQYEADLAKALKDAEDDGTVSPQEIHQLMAQARGSGMLRSGDGTKAGDARAKAGNLWEQGKVLWGQPFALAEQFNRRSTFIAAYRTAKEQGIANPAEFARQAVLETQFVYTKANKPRWARGAVGGTLFTFKTYSVSYLELMQRMWTQGGPEGKRAVGWALVMLLLMSGAGGVPFMEDAEDLIDGAGQLMGYNISAKQWRKELLASVVGAELGEFMEQGLSGLPGAPIDVSGRLGMGNLIPGTGLFLNKPNRERDLMEVVGPAGDLVARGFTGARKLLGGDVGGAALEVSPTAVRNLVKGVDMGVSGMYKDTKGYKVIDTTLAEAAAKAIGFQPKTVAEVQEANSFMQRSKSFYTQTSSEIKAQWADALFRKDEVAVQRVRDRLARWNRDNPEQPIVVKMPDVWKRVREMGKDRSDRIADTAPKALREQMRAEVAALR